MSRKNLDGAWVNQIQCASAQIRYNILLGNSKGITMYSLQMPNAFSLARQKCQKPTLPPTGTLGAMFGVYMDKWGRLVVFPVLCLLASGTLLTQKRVWQWHFSCCFCQHLGILGPKYTPASKDYIHTFLFWELIPEKLHLSYIEIFSRINFPKITLHVFVCDSENYMKNVWDFLEKSHFSYIKRMFSELI